MLDKQDLQAIAELIDTRISASEERMKRYIKETVTEETNNSIAYTENAVEPKLAAIQEGIDFAMERPRVSPERVERLEEDVIVLKSVVRSHSEEIEQLKKAQ